MTLITIIILLLDYSERCLVVTFGRHSEHITAIPTAMRFTFIFESGVAVWLVRILHESVVFNGWVEEATAIIVPCITRGELCTGVSFRLVVPSLDLVA